MNAPHDLMSTLAWSLLHFLWQGAAIAACAAALIHVFRTPSTRYLIGVGALALMLMSFGVTFSLLNGIAEPSAAATAAGAPAAALAPPAGTFAPSNMPWTEGQAATDSSFDFVWLARAWLVGVFVLALRIAFGLFVLEQLRRRNLLKLPDALVARFQVLQRRLGIQRAIRYAECGMVSVPAVIGFFRPVVLIPMRALTGLSTEQLEALVAHELGHIRRFDVAVNFVQVIAETLFFFHPAVWWLNKRIRADREDCCDDIAVSAGGNSVGYAKALATIAHWRDVPSFAMAATGGPVAARVARLLGVQNKGGARAGMFTATLVLAGALLAGAVSLGLAKPAQAQTAVENEPNVGNEPKVLAQTTAAPVVSAAPVAPPAPPAAPSAVPSPAAKPVPAPKPVKEPKPAKEAKPATAAKPAKEAKHAARVEAAHGGTSYLDEIRVEFENLDVDTIIALKTQDVTAEYIHEIRSTGLNPSPEQIIAMKVHDITPEYYRQVNSMGFKVTTDELIAFKVHDVSPEFVKQVAGMGLNVDADSIIALRVQDVSGEYVKAMRDLGFKFSTDELIAMKVHDITPEYVQKMRAAGFKMSTDELIALKVHDVTPEFRKGLEASGFKMSTDQVIHAKVMDLSPEFIAKAKAHGFVNLNIDQLIALKNADVL